MPPAGQQYRMHALSLGRHLRQRGIRLRQLIRPYVARLRHTQKNAGAFQLPGVVLRQTRQRLRPARLHCGGVRGKALRHGMLLRQQLAAFGFKRTLLTDGRNGRCAAAQ